MNRPTRRHVLTGGGALVVAFALRPALTMADDVVGEGSGATGSHASLAGSLKKTPFLDSWIRIEPSGFVTVFTGKAELGQGIRTALAQVAAEELDVGLMAITMQTADTGSTPDEGYTAGSHSMQDSGSAIRVAAAQARALLVAEAARRIDLPADRLTTRDGAVLGPEGQRFPYGALVEHLDLHVEATATPPLKQPAQYAVVGRPTPRLDIPAKVTGGAAYVHDLRLPGLLHARVVRPPSYGAKLALYDRASIEKLPGVVAVVQDGSFLAVVAEGEYRAVQAMRRLAATARWTETARLPAGRSPRDMLLALPAEDTVILARGLALDGGGRTVEASYTRPYQAHGSIGPSCAVAQLKDGLMTVWTHTQGVFPDRQAIAELLKLPPEAVRCIHTEGSGCYGHNGADDAAGDAALIARAVPGRPVRVQLMREQEAAWEPFGPAMATKARARLDASGTIVDWAYEVWSNTHNLRPGGAGALLAAQLLAEPIAPPPPKPIPQPEGGGDRNAIPIYALPSARVVHHFVPTMPLRVSAMRALGAYANVFSIESFMDELAAAAQIDPVAFRLKHLDDERAKDVIRTAAERFGWGQRSKAPGVGFGFAFARYKNLAAYCAIAVEVSVDHETGRTRLTHAVAAVDSGQVVNPDGLRNQIEGAIVQSMSWTLFESVDFDERRITSVDWSTYPILRFDGVPESVEVHIVERPGQPFLGSGEAGQGPTAAAIGNAIHDATGQRLRDLPFTREKVKGAIGV